MAAASPQSPSPLPVGVASVGGARFAFRYAVLAATAFGLYCIPYAELGLSERGFDAYLRAYATLVGGVLGIFEPELVVTGTTLYGRFALTIVKNCDAMEVKILLVSAILALPDIPFVRRLGAAAVALASVVVLNVTRIVSLYYAGIYAPGAFERLHLEIWPLVLVVFAVLEFLLLARFLEAGRPLNLRALLRGFRRRGTQTAPHPEA